MMNATNCLIQECGQSAYAPAGTQALCKEHFLHFLTWRRKKGGASMFRKYGGMTMEERDPIVSEWSQTLTARS